jgi:transcriptional regulator with XRE-family HTH domain
MKKTCWHIRRIALGLRQRDVAELAAISQSRYSMLERGEVTPDERETEAINRSLRLPHEVWVELLEGRPPAT